MSVMLEFEAFVDLAEDLAQPVDLLVGVRGGDLDAEADLVLRHERIGRHRDVDPAGEEVAADRVDVLVIREGDLDERVAGLVRRVDVELVSRSSTVGSSDGGRAGSGRRAPRSLQARDRVASEATGEGPEYRYGGAATFRTFFRCVGRARNASSEEYALRESGDEDHVLVGLALMADRPVAALALVAELVRLRARR